MFWDPCGVQNMVLNILTNHIICSLSSLRPPSDKIKQINATYCPNHTDLTLYKSNMIFLWFISHLIVTILSLAIAIRSIYKSHHKNNLNGTPNKLTFLMFTFWFHATSIILTCLYDYRLTDFQFCSQIVT